MIAIEKCERHMQINPVHASDVCEECKEQLADAEKELGAFLKGFTELFGTEAADQAATCWVTLAENTAPPRSSDPRHWRRISILAASQMATRCGLRRRIPDGLVRRET